MKLYRRLEDWLLFSPLLASPSTEDKQFLSPPIFPLQAFMHRWLLFCLPQWQWNFPKWKGGKKERVREKSWIAPNGMQRSPVNLRPWGAEGVQGCMLYGEGLFGRTDITWRRNSQAGCICRKRERNIRVESQPIWSLERKTAIQTQWRVRDSLCLFKGTRCSHLIENQEDRECKFDVIEMKVWGCTYTSIDLHFTST